MAEVYRAVDEPASSRLDYWEHVVNTVLFRSRSRYPEPPGERDWFRTGRLGQVDVAEWSSSPKWLVHSRTHMRDTDDGYVGMVVPTHGSVRTRGSAGRRVVPPGALVVNAMTHPFECVHGPTRGVNVRVPRALFPARHRVLDQMQGIPLVARNGLTTLATSMVLELPRHLDEPDATVGDRLSGALLGVLGAALAGRSVVPADDPSGRDALRAQVRAHIDARLGDPSLSPATIAGAHHMSVRALHKLFEEDETTVAAYVRERRLESARLRLADPEARDRSVAAIAHGLGFASLAHFTRLFRRTYGIPPGEYRRLMLRVP